MKYKILSRESNSEWRALPSGYSAFIRGPRAAVHRLLSLPLPLSLLSDNERCSFAPDPFEIRLLLGRCRRTHNEQWITTPLYRMILSNSERGMMHEDTSSCRWLTSTTPTDPIVRNELRSPDTVRCKRAVHITCSLPDAINDISRTRNEPRSFGKFLSLSTVSSFCLISSEFALTVFRWEEEEEGGWLIGSTSGKSSRGRYYANR